MLHVAARPFSLNLPHPCLTCSTFRLNVPATLSLLAICNQESSLSYVVHLRPLGSAEQASGILELLHSVSLPLVLAELYLRCLLLDRTNRAWADCFPGHRCHIDSRTDVVREIDCTLANDFINAEPAFICLPAFIVYTHARCLDLRHNLTASSSSFTKPFIRCSKQQPGPCAGVHSPVAESRTLQDAQSW